MKIDRFEIGAGRTFVIAEIGNNHNGDFDRAIALVDHAVEAGADCAKFQMRHMSSVYRQRTLAKAGEDLGTEYVLDLLARFELTVEQHRALFDYCASKGILYLCTPWDLGSFRTLDDMGVKAFKVASADLTNMQLVGALARTGKPLILSTGMSREDEIGVTAEFLAGEGSPFVLLHCNSTYPAPLHDINLRWMNRLKAIHPFYGYSGHERGIAVTLGAVALGAMVVERHLTLDRNMEGPDHAASLEAGEFRRMVDGIRDIEQALGTGERRFVSQGEMINRENLAKSLVAAMPLAAGIVIEERHVRVRSPGQGLSPQKYGALIGRTLRRDMAEEDYFYPSDLSDERAEARDYRFGRPWGVPVRYHDFVKYRERVRPDLYEFHLSYSDMDLTLSDYLSGTYPEILVVHAPELFAGSHLLDLATPDDDYRARSMAEMQRVIDITRSLKPYFPGTERPLIVTNIGGFTMDAPIAREAKQSYYEQIGASLAALDTAGVEVLPQTMAPFPWHFGGQRYQNLFVEIDEIIEWCDRLDLRMCFDTSHSRLTCNHFKADFYDFAAQIAPLSAHLHLGDAAGLNGEGLQVGDGEIDFARLGTILRDGCPDTGFIPEIWQGHKNGGEGFWVALDRLEGIL